MNVHSGVFDAKIVKVRRDGRYRPQVIQSSENFVKCFNTCLFTNLIHSTFSASYLSKHPCSSCGKPSQERCHGVGEERGVLLQRVLDRLVFPVSLEDIVCAFLEEHKRTGFRLQCSACHKKETRPRPDLTRPQSDLRSS